MEQTNRTDQYVSPFSTRYTSVEMKELFSDDWKFSTWRKIWLEVARGQKRLGVSMISDEQILEMSSHLLDIDYSLAAKLEKEYRHDVIAHMHTFGKVCPLAAPIMHLGLTSCCVTDNTELIQMRDGLRMLIKKLAKCLHRLLLFADNYSGLPTLGFTHIQSAQPVTVGKRACMWLQDLTVHLLALEEITSGLKFRGLKGATGTQASMLEVFDGNKKAVSDLELYLARIFGFADRIWPITGQTYPRLVDTQILQALACLAASIHKIFLDLRVLQHLKEIEEPFEKNQKGSSAMAYKRNPMRGERACAIARHVAVLPTEALMTQALQIFERTLDDSAGRRIYIPEAFLATDALLIICQNVFEGLVVHPRVIEKHLAEELPFMATEEIIVAMVEAGHNRQEVHEKLVIMAQEAGFRVKDLGTSNQLMEMIGKDSFFAPIHSQLKDLLDAHRFIGRSKEQTESFLNEVASILRMYPEATEGKSELKV